MRDFKMTRSFVIIFALFFSLVILSCADNSGSLEEQSLDPIADNFSELRTELSVLNREFIAERTSTRAGFFKRFWERLCCVVYADAGAAAGTYDRLEGERWSARKGAEIIAGAIRGSWEEVWNPVTEVEYEEEDVQMADVKKGEPEGGYDYLLGNDIIKCVYINHHDYGQKVISNSESIKKLHLNNPFEAYGKIHNEALLSYSKRVVSADTLYRKEDALELLYEEIIQSISTNTEEESFMLDKQEVTEIRNEFLSSDYSFYKRKASTRTTIDQRKSEQESTKKEQSLSPSFFSEELYSSQNELERSMDEVRHLTDYAEGVSYQEAAIMVDYVQMLSNFNELSVLMEYSNRFSDKIQSSNLSEDEKNRINLYVAVATHSIVLWSDIFSR